MAKRRQDDVPHPRRAQANANFDMDVVSAWAAAHGAERKSSCDQAYELLRMGAFTEKFLRDIFPKQLMVGLRKIMRSDQVRHADGRRIKMHSVLVVDEATEEPYRSYVDLDAMILKEINFVMRETLGRETYMRDKRNYLGNYAITKFGWIARDVLIDFDLLDDPGQAVDPDDIAEEPEDDGPPRPEDDI